MAPAALGEALMREPAQFAGPPGLGGGQVVPPVGVGGRVVELAPVVVRLDELRVRRADGA